MYDFEATMKHPFSESELIGLKRMSWFERRRIRARREGRLFDSWTADPDRSLMGGGVQGWEETLESITSDGVQVSNTVTETIICPDFNIPAYYMAPGRTMRIWAYGVMSNVVTTPGTLIMAIRWGGVGGVVLVQSAAQGLDTTARTNALWALQAYIVCRTSGATGTFEGGGIMFGNVLSTAATNLLPALLGSAGTPLASGNAAVTVDTTTAKLLSVTAKFSVATSPTNLTAQQRIIEVLN
jgi:hypothetical protein